MDAILKGRTGAANCLTCAKGVKLKSPLKSLAWTSGTDAYSKPKVMPKLAPAKDVVLPQGTEIEVDATDDANKAASEPKQSVRPTPVKPVKPAAKPATTPADAPASAPKAASEPATAPCLCSCERYSDKQRTGRFAVLSRTKYIAKGRLK